MKHIMLPTRIALVSLAYFISFLLLYNSQVFQELLKLPRGSLAINVINLIALLLIGLAYIASKNGLSAATVICMIYSAFSVIPHSKLSYSILGIEASTNLAQHWTTLLFFAVVMLLLISGRLKRCEKETQALIDNGAEEEAAKLICFNGLKLYLIFAAVVLGLIMLLVAVGAILQNLKGNPTAIVVIGASGIVIIVGCLVFLYKKWRIKADNINM